MPAAPVAVDDLFNVVAGQGSSAANVLTNDTDADGNPLTAIQVTGTAHGAVTLNSNGSFTYTPDTGYTGKDSFTYKANDGTSDSNIATVLLNVGGLEAPVAADDSYSLLHDKTLNRSSFDGLLLNDSDPNDNALTVASVNGSSANVGTQVTLASGAKVTVNADGGFSYIPVATSVVIV